MVEEGKERSVDTRSSVHYCLVRVKALCVLCIVDSDGLSTKGPLCQDPEDPEACLGDLLRGTEPGKKIVMNHTRKPQFEGQ